jgi:hypothetical protein
MWRQSGAKHTRVADLSHGPAARVQIITSGVSRRSASSHSLLSSVSWGVPRMPGVRLSLSALFAPVLADGQTGAPARAAAHLRGDVQGQTQSRPSGSASGQGVGANSNARSLGASGAGSRPPPDDRDRVPGDTNAPPPSSRPICPSRTGRNSFTTPPRPAPSPTASCTRACSSRSRESRDAATRRSKAELRPKTTTVDSVPTRPRPALPTGSHPSVRTLSRSRSARSKRRASS